MHTLDSYKFQTQDEALAFANLQRNNSSPIEDKYVRGPFFMDDEVTFKCDSYNFSKEKYWVVTVEIFV
jgi:hypothetical protein